MKPVRNGVLFLAHGSRREAGNDEIRNIVQKVKAQDQHKRIFGLAFLEFGQPDISQSVANLAELGVDRITAIPLFLAAGKHIWRDIPAVLQQLQQKYPHIHITQGKHIGLSALLPDLLLDLISQGEGVKNEHQRLL